MGSLVGLRLGSIRIFHAKELDPAYEKVPNFDAKDPKYQLIEGGPDPIPFKLGTLSSRQLVHLRDAATEFVPDPEDPTQVTAKFLPNKSAYETVQLGLKGWGDNFLFEDGKPVVFETKTKSVAGRQCDVVADSVMDCLSIDLIRVLADGITGDNELSEEQAKNSDE